MLACPVCGAGLTATATGLRCAAGHAFDRARQGHVTLLPPSHRAPSGDSAEMVADRAAFLAGGHYDGVTAALAAAVLADGEPRALLDLGGGTGHHLAAVLDRVPDAAGVVLDSSPYAARRAARAHPRAAAVVADAWRRLPVADAVADRVLVVFAPRNGPEIARVLRPGGRLVVVTPAPDHLAELVGPLGLLRVDPDKQARLTAGLEPGLRQVAAAAHREPLALRHDAVLALVGMGPHARHLSRDQLRTALAALPEPAEVTVSVDVTTWARSDGS
jgi:23S rRNA (guanine745-N1)-methyltransferase